MDYSWTARIRWVGDVESTVYARNHSFTVGQPVSFKQRDPHLSAVEYLLGALGADLTNGFGREMIRRGIEVDAMELALSGRVENVLVHLGVIGESGEPTFREINGTLYVSADAEESNLREAWETILQRSPIANTLKHAATISIELRVAY
ncbi:MAG: OsmC family protein [Chloroflexota bacterium]